MYMNTRKANQHLERAMELLQSTEVNAFGKNAFGSRRPKAQDKPKSGRVNVVLKYTKDNKDAFLKIGIDSSYDAGGVIAGPRSRPVWRAEGTHGNTPFHLMFHVTDDERWNAEVRENNIPILEGATNIRVVSPGQKRNRSMASLIASLKKGVHTVSHA